MEPRTKEPKVKRAVSSIKTRKRTKVQRKQSKSPEDIIRKRAYEIYLERGADSGSETDDWNKAENEIVFSHRKEAQYGKDTM
jgi:hypothetical protein